MKLWKLLLIAALGITSACQPTGTSPLLTVTPDDACGASEYAQYENGPLSAIRNLGIPNNSRYFGHTISLRELTEPHIDHSRLNFITSGDSTVDAVTNADAIILRIFCG